MSLQALLTRWRSQVEVADNVVEWRRLPARASQFTAFPPEMHPAILQALEAGGISALYSHQAQAWEYAHLGQHVVVVTGTASGKTLCYNLPVLDRFLRDEKARALYLFPTKALAQDQLSGFRSLAENLRSANIPDTLPAVTEAAASIYDGDTPAHARPAIRTNARLVLTNPDMLHTGILPHHTAWAEFFQNLQFVVVDEIHTYRGVFGSHVANVLRRLRRVAAFYGARPIFILTSATIANPLQLAGWLVEAPVNLVDQDGSARGPKHFLIYNPPITNKELGLRRSSLQESVRLADDLLTYQVQTIIFGGSRRSVELMLRALRERMGQAAQESIRGYRSGYLARERRSIENGLRKGQVRAVVATTALELGIDIGQMGAAILAGYPGSIAATWQQAGRAGRGADSSLALLITSPDPLDQFLAHHPEYFFDRDPENALVNPDNLLILLGHLRCAAFEIPFRIGEGFGNLPAGHTKEFLDFLEQEGVLHFSGERYFWMADHYPAEGLSLRSASADAILLQVDQDGEPVTLGLVDIPSAARLVHPGAIYLHEAAAYLVDELDLEHAIARLKPANTDYYTEPGSEVTVELVEKLAESKGIGCLRSYGELTVTTQVTGYRKIRWNTHETLGRGEVSLPPTQLQTVGYWLMIEDETVEQLRSMGLWTNDPNEYGPEWPALREQVRRRDGYRCQMCGLPEQGRSHDVHHKVPFRTFSSHIQANQISNLITLCPSCHRRAETAIRLRSGLAGLAFVLGNLAPLFLMCDTRDLGVHSDPQSSLADGKPVVVLYDQVPAGIGLSERIYEIHAELVEEAYKLVKTCECADGCPSCVGPGGENGAGGKKETLALLERLIENTT